MTGGGPGPAVTEIAHVIAGELAGARWGAMPCLYAVTVDGGRCVLRPLPVPGRVWETGTPADVLARLAGDPGLVMSIIAAGATPAGTAPAEVAGAAFRYEGWGLFPDSATEEQFQEAAEGRAGPLSEHPSRREVRVINAVDRDGTSYSAVQRRGEDRLYVSVHLPGPGVPDEGLIPDSLRLLANAVATPAPDASLAEGTAGPAHWLAANGYRLITAEVWERPEGPPVPVAYGTRPGNQHAFAFQVTDPGERPEWAGFLRAEHPRLAVRIDGELVIATGDGPAMGLRRPGTPGVEPPEAAP